MSDVRFTPPFEGQQFTSHQQWVNKASSWLTCHPEHNNTEHGERAYWWDLDGESPVDPIEFLPHPLDPRFAATASEGSADA